MNHGKNKQSVIFWEHHISTVSWLEPVGTDMTLKQKFELNQFFLIQWRQVQSIRFNVLLFYIYMCVCVLCVLLLVVP